MNRKLLLSLLVMAVLLLGGCMPLGRNPLSLVVVLLDLAIQIIGLIGLLYAAYRRLRSETQPAGDNTPAPTKPARLKGNST